MILLLSFCSHIMDKFLIHTVEHFPLFPHRERHQPNRRMYSSHHKVPWQWQRWTILYFSSFILVLLNIWHILVAWFFGNHFGCTCFSALLDQENPIRREELVTINQKPVGFQGIIRKNHGSWTIIGDQKSCFFFKHLFLLEGKTDKPQTFGLRIWFGELLLPRCGLHLLRFNWFIRRGKHTDSAGWKKRGWNEDVRPYQFCWWPFWDG